MAVIPLLLFLFTTVDTVSVAIVAPTVMGLERYELGEKQKSLRGKSYSNIKQLNPIVTQPEAGVIHCGLAIIENSKPEIKQHLTKSCRVLKLVQHIYIRKAASSAYIREKAASSAYKAA